MTDELRYCPECQTDLQGEAIPEEDQELFGGSTHFMRQIAIYDRDLDCTVGYKCPDGGHCWPRRAGGLTQTRRDGK